MQLRDYQQAALTAIIAANKQGINKQVAVLATGLGKTVIFSHLISQRVSQTNKKALILAHREELLFQAKDKLQKINPVLKIGIEQATTVADHNHDDVVIASVASIGRTGSARLMQFDPRQYGTIIIDEAHHASAASYKVILNHFGVLKGDNDHNKDILLLGVTATPNRNDNEGIDQIFDEVVYDYTILDGIKNGWLSSIKAYKINTQTNIETVTITAGDFSTRDLEQAINTSERNALIVQTYLDIASGKQALVFAADVLHTTDLTASFLARGVAAAYISGETPKDERQELLRKFADKQITVMVNALVLTEGYDNAGIEYIFMARPTKSGLLYQQMIGRGTRVHPGKSYLVIVDFVDNTSKHQLQTAATLLGLSGTVDFQGQDILETAGRIDALLEKRPYYDLNRLHVTKIDYLLREVDLLQEKALSKQEENYTWHKFGAGMRMHNGKNRYFFIEQSLTGQYMLFEFLRIIHKKKQIGIFATQGEAMRYADAQIVSAFSGMPQPLSPSYGHTMNYSTDLPSEAQMALLRELGVEEKTILFLNKRDASLLISQKKRGR